MKSIEGIRQRCRNARRLNYYDKMYALQLFISGYYGVLDEDTVTRTRSTVGSDCDLPDYPELEPDFGPKGVQNHGLINAKINVQGVVTANPSITVMSPDNTVKQVNEAYFHQLWQLRGWDEQVDLGGIEVEANGIALFVAGINDGMPDWVHSPLLDTLFDAAYRSPSQWRWFNRRVRLPLDDAFEKYGHLWPGEGMEKIKALSTAAPAILGGKVGRAQEEGREEVLHEWSYWDSEHHIVFLGSISGGKSCPVAFGPMGPEDGPWGYKLADEAGPNPYGIVPRACWMDAWAPGIKTPTPKSETTIRLASMLNDIEGFMVRCVTEGLPVLVVDGSRISPELLDKIKEIKSVKDMDRILINEGGGDIKDMLQRLEPVEVPRVCIELRSILNEQINAATGVMDMQRGQALTGERTRYEVKQLVDQAGVQARHVRNKYASFLEDMVRVTRAVGAAGDIAPRTLYLDDGPFDINSDSGFSIAPFLSSDLPVKVDPNSLVPISDDERKATVMAEFENVTMVGIQLGVVDKYKAFTDIYKKMGRRDPTEIMITPQEQQQIADIQKQVAQKNLDAQNQPPPDAPQGPSTGADKVKESMAYKDAPPDIRRQMEKERGYRPSTEKEVSPNAPKPDPAPAGRAPGEAKPKPKAKAA